MPPPTTIAPQPWLVMMAAMRRYIYRRIVLAEGVVAAETPWKRIYLATRNFISFLWAKRWVQRRLNLFGILLEGENIFLSKFICLFVYFAGNAHWGKNRCMKKSDDDKVKWRRTRIFKRELWEFSRENFLTRNRIFVFICLFVCLAGNVR